MMSPRWKPSCCAQRAVGDVDDDHALGRCIEPQFVGQRRRQIGHLGAEERRARTGSRSRRAASPARSRSATATLISLAAAHARRAARCAAERLGGEAIVEGIRIVDRLAVDRDDDVAGLEAGPRRRAARGDAGDQRAGRPLEAELLGDLGRHRLQLGAEPRPLAPRCRRSWPRPPPRAPCWREWRSRCPASRPSARRSRC